MLLSLSNRFAFTPVQATLITRRFFSNVGIQEYLQKHSITIKNGKDLCVMEDIKSTPFPQRLVEYLAMNNITKPTPIQAAGWPLVLSGSNMIGIAETGSGKTLSFALPLITNVLERGHSATREPKAIVVLPTRELCIQVSKVVTELAEKVDLSVGSFYGGTSESRDIDRCQSGMDIVIGTPGRLNKLCAAYGALNLSKCSFVVLDEADWMLSMGFKAEIEGIFSMVPAQRQVIMWSATWPAAVQYLADEYVGRTSPRIVVGSERLTANPRVTQKVVITRSGAEKERHLISLLSSCNKALVFCNSKTQGKILCYNLSRAGHDVAFMSSDSSQQMRTQMINSFTGTGLKTLVATDVAARGLDIKSIDLVVNYDMPREISTYIHRIGRTARGLESKGTAVTFVGTGDGGVIADLERVLTESNQEIPPGLDALKSFGGSKSYGGFGNRPMGVSGNRRSGFQGGFNNNSFDFKSTFSDGGNSFEKPMQWNNQSNSSERPFKSSFGSSFQNSFTDDSKFSSPKSFQNSSKSSLFEKFFNKD